MADEALNRIRTVVLFHPLLLEVISPVLCLYLVLPASGQQLGDVCTCRWWQGTDPLTRHRVSRGWASICSMLRCIRCAVQWMGGGCWMSSFMDSLHSGILNFWALNCAVFSISLTVLRGAALWAAEYLMVLCQKQVIRVRAFWGRAEEQ